VGVSALLAAVIKAWKAVLGGSFTGVPAAVVLTLFSLPFLAGEGFGILMLYVSASAGVFVALISMIGVNVLFHRLLKAPTRAGRQQSPAYAPSWYSGPGVAGFSAAAFTSAFSSSFSSAISSSSTAPGSSSGSGGGGSSGGGGGGGGGGGW